MLIRLSNLQLRLLADFFTNMSVVCFAAAMASSSEILTSLKFVTLGILTLYFGMIIMREVKKE